VLRKLTNKTEDPQQIMYIGGGSEMLLPREFVEVDMDRLYNEERERLKNFFDFGDNPDRVRVIRSIKFIEDIKTERDVRVLKKIKEV
jgi:hypothetical protein